MEDFNSKYTGEQVEQLLDQVASGNAGGGGGGITIETDPIFSASPAATITEEKIAEWNGKQDAISDLAAIREGAALGATALQEHQDISGKQDKLVSGTNIKTINGYSLLGSGNIVISGGEGGGYDDTEIKGQISEIESTIGDINTILESIISG